MAREEEITEGFHTADELAQAFLVGCLEEMIAERLEAMPSYFLRVGRMFSGYLETEIGTGIQLVEYNEFERLANRYYKVNVLVDGWNIVMSSAIKRAVDYIRRTQP